MDFSDFYERRINYNYDEDYNTKLNIHCIGTCNNELFTKYDEFYISKKLYMYYCANCFLNIFDKIQIYNDEKSNECYGCNEIILPNDEHILFHKKIHICTLCYDNNYDKVKEKITNTFMSKDEMKYYFNHYSNINPLKKYVDQELILPNEISKHISNEKDIKFLEIIKKIEKQYHNIINIDDNDIFKWTILTQEIISNINISWSLMIKCEPPYRIATVENIVIKPIFDSYQEFITALDIWAMNFDENKKIKNMDYIMMCGCTLFPEYDYINDKIQYIIEENKKMFGLDGDY